MHGHSLMTFIDRRHQTDDFEFQPLPQDIQRPRAVFAAAPRQENFGPAAQFSACSKEKISRMNNCRNSLGKANQQLGFRHSRML